MNVELTDEEIDQVFFDFTLSTQLSEADDKLKKLLSLPRKKKKAQKEEILRMRRIIEICLKRMK